MQTTTSQQQEQSQVRLEAPALPASQTTLVALGLAGAFLLSYVTYQIADLQMAILLWVGLLLGFTLFHARFGFTSAFRRFMAVGNGEALRAHMLMLAAASTLFALIFSTGTGLFGTEPAGFVSPIGVSVVVGAFLFGIGMQLGSG
ncbi:putative membrane protein YedE/YeeE [Caldalkalibacillus uzonensis]|uniref:Membrane protein YedE/YeeE n=1 Tax=Caldalkalibacillus uzonensis TaxID=353224 RepID=A0ABU0CQ79_9BACI|nr:putative membrane protein YedE/YeeE [Caldalkalibacillus uzonensis]